MRWFQRCGGLAAATALLLAGCNGASEPGGARIEAPSAVEIATDSNQFEIPSGVAGVPPIAVEVLERGDGMAAEKGDVALVHYTGTLADGTVFDTSRSADRDPFEFRLGAGMAIRGWDLVVQQMRIGDRWKVEIPSELAYGKRGHPAGIAPNTDLQFDMELLRLR